MGKFEAKFLAIIYYSKNRGIQEKLNETKRYVAPSISRKSWDEIVVLQRHFTSTGPS